MSFTALYSIDEDCPVFRLVTTKLLSSTSVIWPLTVVPSFSLTVTGSPTSQRFSTFTNFLIFCACFSSTVCRCCWAASGTAEAPATRIAKRQHMISLGITLTLFRRRLISKTLQIFHSTSGIEQDDALV